MHQETARLYPGANSLRLAVREALPAGLYQLSGPEFHFSRKVALRCPRRDALPKGKRKKARKTRWRSA